MSDLISSFSGLIRWCRYLIMFENDSDIIKLKMTLECPPDSYRCIIWACSTYFPGLFECPTGSSKYINYICPGSWWEERVHCSLKGFWLNLTFKMAYRSVSIDHSKTRVRYYPCILGLFSFVHRNGWHQFLKYSYLSQSGYALFRNRYRLWTAN